jgi:hypothetical protein
MPGIEMKGCPRLSLGLPKAIPARDGGRTIDKSIIPRYFTQKKPAALFGGQVFFSTI